MAGESLDNPSRRRVLKYSGGALAVSLLGPRVLAGTEAPAAPGAALIGLSATEAVARMTSGALDAETYAAALLRRAAATDLNAFIALDPEQALAAARAADRRRARGERLGALHGLPVPVKDSIFTADYPTTAGTAALRALERRVDAPLVARLKAAGAFVMGKTNLHELSTGHTSNNETFGPVRNPFDPARVPGGSSGGTAAAVAAGMAPLGIAEDTFGSIRVPAALCGAVGFRPTTGRYPNAEAVPLTPRFDQLGPIARSVADVVLFDTVMTGATIDRKADTLASVRLGVPRTHFFEGLAADAGEVIEDALRRLQRAGATLVEADVPDVKTLIEQAYFPILGYEVYANLDAFLRRAGVSGGLTEVLAGAGPDIRARYESALLPGAPEAVPDEVYRRALHTLQRLREAARDYFSRHDLDAMVFPTTLVAAPAIGEDDATVVDGARMPLVIALGNNQPLAPSCALPALTLPAGLTRSGLPVGIEFDAPSLADERLLALGPALEKALGPLPATALG